MTRQTTRSLFIRVTWGLVGLSLLAGVRPTVFSAQTEKPIRVSSLIAAGLLRECDPPVYPREAEEQEIGDDVILEVVIDREGAVSSVHTLSGDPVLRPAAEEAVRRWRYAPYVSEGEPARVVSTVTLRFPGPPDGEPEDPTARCYVPS